MIRASATKAAPRLFSKLTSIAASMAKNRANRSLLRNHPRQGDWYRADLLWPLHHKDEI